MAECSVKVLPIKMLTVQNRLCVYRAWVEGNGVKINCALAMMALAKYCVMLDKQELAGFKYGCGRRNKEKLWSWKITNHFCIQIQKIGDWKKLGTKTPKKTLFEQTC